MTKPVNSLTLLSTTLTVRRFKTRGPLKNVFDDAPEFHKFPEARWLKKIMKRRMPLRARLISWRTGGRENYDRRLGATFALPQARKYGIAIVLREMEVKKKELRARVFRVLVNLVNERDRLSAVADDAKLEAQMLLFKRFTDQEYIPFVVLCKQNVLT